MHGRCELWAFLVCGASFHTLPLSLTSPNAQIFELAFGKYLFDPVGDDKLSKDIGMVFYDA